MAVVTRIVTTHDYLLAFVPLLTKPPWMKRTRKGVYKYEEGRWGLVPARDTVRITKTEAQVGPPGEGRGFEAKGKGCSLVVAAGPYSQTVNARTSSHSRTHPLVHTHSRTYTHTHTRA